MVDVEKLKKAYQVLEGSVEMAQGFRGGSNGKHQTAIVDPIPNEWRPLSPYRRINLPFLRMNQWYHSWRFTILGQGEHAIQMAFYLLTYTTVIALIKLFKRSLETAL